MIYDNVTFNKCQIKDIPVIFKIASKAFPETFSSILDHEQMDYMMDMMYENEVLTRDIGNGDQNYFLMYVNGDPCGYISITTPDRFIRERIEFCHKKNGSPANMQVIKDCKKPVYLLHKVYLLPEKKGCGLGRCLLEYAEDTVSRMSKGKSLLMILQVNRKNPAVGFYKHLGMRIIGSQDFVLDHGFEMNDFVMAIDIN